MKLIRLKQSPMSSKWNFAGEKNGYKFYRSRNGVLFASFDEPNGRVWYKVVTR